VISDRVKRFLKERSKDCLLKPFSLVEFREAVEQALNRGKALQTIETEEAETAQ